MPRCEFDIVRFLDPKVVFDFLQASNVSAASMTGWEALAHLTVERLLPNDAPAQQSSRFSLQLCIDMQRFAHTGRHVNGPSMAHKW